MLARSEPIDCGGAQVRSLRLLSALRAAPASVLALLLVLQSLRAALVPLAAWATGLVVAQAGGPIGASMALGLVAFVVALWLGESVGHALWLVRAHVARAVDGRIRSDLRLALASAPSLAVVDDPGFRDDIAHVMATGGARGYEQSFGTAAWSQLARWFDVVEIAAVGLVLAPLSTPYAIGAVLAMLVIRWTLQRTWRREAETESEGARGQRRTAYWTALGTGDAAAKEIRVFGVGDWVRQRRRAQAEDYLHPRWRRHAGQLRSVLLPGGLTAVAAAFALAVPSWAAAAGTIGPADLARYVVAGLGLLAMVGAGALGWHVEYGHVVLAARERVLDRLRPATDAADHPQTSDPETSDPETADPKTADPKTAGPEVVGVGATDVVELRGVGFAYRDGPPVLADLDLRIAPGEVVAVVGPNGAGKTTLMTLLADLVAPTSGSVRVPPRAATAVLFADFVRYPLSLLENVAVAAPEVVDRAAVDRALRLAGAGDLPGTLPQGLATPMSALFDGGVDLSGGQWQKVALARAIFAVQQGRRLLIMDEPTAHLDAAQEATFYDHVVKALSGTTMVLVSHRLSTVRSADRILLLEHGRILEEGDHGSLLRSGGRYAAMFSLQASRFASTGESTGSGAG